MTRYKIPFNPLSQNLSQNWAGTKTVAFQLLFPLPPFQLFRLNSGSPVQVNYTLQMSCTSALWSLGNTRQTQLPSQTSASSDDSFTFSGDRVRCSWGWNCTPSMVLKAHFCTHAQSSKLRCFLPPPHYRIRPLCCSASVWPFWAARQGN